MSWCGAQSGAFDQRLFFFQSYCLCIFWAPSLTRDRVCHVPVFVIEVYNSQSLFTTNIYIKLKMYNVTHIYSTIQYLQYIQASFSPGSVQQIMPYLLVISLPRRSNVTLSGSFIVSSPGGPISGGIPAWGWYGR
jgi:hypothetical protein